MSQELERAVIGLVATDRLYRPSSSFDGKLERRRPKIAKAIIGCKEFDGSFQGDRAYARFEADNKQVARGMRDGITKFTQEFPQYGAILNGMIEEKRAKSEKHLYFGMQDGRRLAHEDYMSVLTDMGLSEQRAEQYYEVAIEISRTLQKKSGDIERSVLVKD